MIALPPARPSTTVYLHAGQLAASDLGDVYATVLGSCVSVTLFDPLLRVGGINHFLLPFHASPGADSGRFGNTAVEALLARMDALGCARRRLVAKVFGGARPGGGDGALGLRNAQVAREALGAARITIAAESVGGPRGRKVIFHSGQGDAWVKEL